MRAGSVAGQAHALELTGVAWYGCGDVQAAEDTLSEAESRYRSIGDDTGLARCARHRMLIRGEQPEWSPTE